MFRLATEAEVPRLCRAISLIFALLIALGWFEPTAAQPIERPADCTEAITVGTVFIVTPTPITYHPDCR